MTATWPLFDSVMSSLFSTLLGLFRGAEGSIGDSNGTANKQPQRLSQMKSTRGPRGFTGRSDHSAADVRHHKPLWRE